MSYIRWLCAMHYAKIARHGNAFVETVNAFRLHRQQKTLACEAAAKARAEFWSRLSESFRRIRMGQPTFFRKPLKPLQTRRQSQTHSTDANVHETGTAAVHGSGSFRSTAKQIITFIFRGRQKLSMAPKVLSMSPLLGSSLRQTRESIDKLLQLQKRSIRSAPQQLQPQRQLSAEFSSKMYASEHPKPLAMFIMGKSCPWWARKPSELQQTAQKSDQKTATATNTPTEENIMPIHSSTHPQSECKASTQHSISNVPQCRWVHESSENQKAMLLPERPNILVLSEIKNNNMTIKKSEANIDEFFRQMCKNAIQEKERQKSSQQLPVPANSLNSNTSCKIATVPSHCILPPQTESSVTLLVTNVLDKYKVISLPAGRAIPGQLKRHVQIETESRQDSTEKCTQSALKGRKV